MKDTQQTKPSVPTESPDQPTSSEMSEDVSDAMESKEQSPGPAIAIAIAVPVPVADPIATPPPRPPPPPPTSPPTAPPPDAPPSIEVAAAAEPVAEVIDDKMQNELDVPAVEPVPAPLPPPAAVVVIADGTKPPVIGSPAATPPTPSAAASAVPAIEPERVMGYETGSLSARSRSQSIVGASVTPNPTPNSSPNNDKVSPVPEQQPLPESPPKTEPTAATSNGDSVPAVAVSIPSIMPFPVIPPTNFLPGIPSLGIPSIPAMVPLAANLPAMVPFNQIHVSSSYWKQSPYGVPNGSGTCPYEQWMDQILKTRQKYGWEEDNITAPLPTVPKNIQEVLYQIQNMKYNPMVSVPPNPYAQPPPPIMTPLSALRAARSGTTQTPFQSVPPSPLPTHGQMEQQWPTHTPPPPPPRHYAPHQQQRGPQYGSQSRTDRGRIMHSGNQSRRGQGHGHHHRDRRSQGHGHHHGNRGRDHFEFDGEDSRHQKRQWGQPQRPWPQRHEWRQNDRGRRGRGRQFRDSANGYDHAHYGPMGPPPPPREMGGDYPPRNGPNGRNGWGPSGGAISADSVEGNAAQIEGINTAHPLPMQSPQSENKEDEDRAPLPIPPRVPPPPPPPVVRGQSPKSTFVPNAAVDPLPSAPKNEMTPPTDMVAIDGVNNDPAIRAPNEMSSSSLSSASPDRDVGALSTQSDPIAEKPKSSGWGPLSFKQRLLDSQKTADDTVVMAIRRTSPQKAGTRKANNGRRKGQQMAIPKDTASAPGSRRASGCDDRERAMERKPRGRERSRGSKQRCFHCGEEGHIRAKCPTFPHGEKCFRCGETGHVAAHCPRKNLSQNEGGGNAKESAMGRNGPNKHFKGQRDPHQQSKRRHEEISQRKHEGQHYGRGRGMRHHGGGRRGQRHNSGGEGMVRPNEQLMNPDGINYFTQKRVQNYRPDGSQSQSANISASGSEFGYDDCRKQYPRKGHGNENGIAPPMASTHPEMQLPSHDNPRNYRKPKKKWIKQGGGDRQQANEENAGHHGGYNGYRRRRGGGGRHSRKRNYSRKHKNGASQQQQQPPQQPQG